MAETMRLSDFPIFSGLKFSALIIVGLLTTSTQALAAGFVPPRNLDPQSAGIQLDNGYDNEAWLVYTYDIDNTGQVVNAKIHSSNGVPEIEAAVLAQVNAMRFRPAMRNDKPVKVSADPIFFTWILDKPREMSPEFERIYTAAWDEFKQAEYDRAFDLAVQLKAHPGRNAFEEIKFQILAASLASRWEDEAAELQHLGRAVELQTLADKNDFINPYIESSQLILIMERIHSLQLSRNMIADAEKTLGQIQVMEAGGIVARRAASDHVMTTRELEKLRDVPVSAELTPIYRDGPGSWKTGLSRDYFSISNVRGKIAGVFLVCGQGDQGLRYPIHDKWHIPTGWTNCFVDVSGRAGTRFTLHQLNE